MREPSSQLTPQQVATYCGVSTQTVDDWLNKGRLHALSKNGQKMVDASELVHFMDENHLAIPVDLIAPEGQMEPANDAPEPVVIEESPASNPQHPFAMVVDNDNATSHTIELVLKDLGLKAIRVANSGEALSYMKRAQPMLLTMELVGGDKSSLELIESLRRDPLSQTKVLVVSNQMPSALIRAKSAGADAILTKPFDNDTFKRTVRILLNINV